MSFYKNANTQISVLKKATEYLLGAIIKYGNIYGEVQILPNFMQCEGNCVFYDICMRDVSNIRCSRETRTDDNDVYFKKIEI